MSETLEIPLDLDDSTDEFSSVKAAKPLQCGDWIWPVFWRPFALPGQPKNGSWETALTRIIAVGKDTICHEVSNPGVAPEDASTQGSFLRWTELSRVYRDQESAMEACRSLPASV